MANQNDEDWKEVARSRVLVRSRTHGYRALLGKDHLWCGRDSFANVLFVQHVP